MLTTILRRAEKTYYDELLSPNNSNIKKTWGTLNVIIKKKFESAVPLFEFNLDNKIYKEKKAVANGFNNFFVNVGPKLAKNIEETEGSIFDYMNNPLKGSFFLESVTIHEVLKIVNASPNKTSMDHSGINFALLKECISFIVKPVCHIANSSFEMGIFPERMKIAKVIPIFKSGKKDFFTNYRPVSLLPQCSKILEKLFNNRLDKFLEINDILSNNQYGFTNNSTTCHALIDLHEQLTKSIDDKLCTIGVFIDLKKAFDTIDHSLLL